MKFTSRYANLGFYDDKGQLQQFENGKFETENKKVIQILKNIKDCIPVSTEEKETENKVEKD